MAKLNNIVGMTVDLGDGNKVIVENMVVEAPSLRHSGTIVRIEGEMVSSDVCNVYQSALNAMKKYAKEDVNSVYGVGSELYRNFQVTPERVIYNDPATIVFWKDGTKTVVKCMEGDTYNPEVGLAMCVCKKLYASKYHKFFRYYAPKEPVAEKTEKKEEASLDEIYDKIAEMTRDVLKTDKSFLEKFASQLFGKEENIK